MKPWLLGLALAAMVLVTQEAMAKRLGGGLSIGRSSGNVTQRHSTPSRSSAAAPSTASTAKSSSAATPSSRWGGVLGGLAAGLGLAWLANSLGLGAGFANVLLIALLALGGWWLLRRLLGASRSPAFAGGPPQGRSATAAFDASAASSGSMIGSALGQGQGQDSPPMGRQSWGMPAGFDEAGFLRACKANFVRLQAAWDAADIAGLKTLMTDELLHDITQQLRDRQAHSLGAPNITEVVSLDAHLLGVEELNDEYLASVEFSGMIKEDPQWPAAPFREVWNIVKSKHQGGWLVAGVQALG